MKISTGAAVVIIIVVVLLVGFWGWKKMAGKSHPTTPTGVNPEAQQSVQQMMQQGGQLTGHGSGNPMAPPGR
ncbi:MAG: hypothetical protein H5T86_13290 [Armatimonadetes bacterium]|nr:hypothetical protein [Armatimonadota bacterium]